MEGGGEGRRGEGEGRRGEGRGKGKRREEGDSTIECETERVEVGGRGGSEREWKRVKGIK